MPRTTIARAQKQLLDPESREQPDLDNETILEILKTGYIHEQDGTVIRKAEVITVLNADG